MQVHVIIRAEPVFQVDDVHVQHQQVDGSKHLGAPSKALHGPDAHAFEWLTVIAIRSLVEDEHADGERVRLTVGVPDWRWGVSSDLKLLAPPTTDGFG